MDMNELRDPDKLREYMIDEELPKAIPFKTEKAFDPNGLSYLKGVGNEYKILPLLNVGNNNEVRLSINVFRGMEPKSFMKPCLGMGDDILSSLRNAIDTARIALFPALQRMLEHDAYSSIETELEDTDNGAKHVEVRSIHGKYMQLMYIREKTMSLPRVKKRSLRYLIGLCRISLRDLAIRSS